mgnify:FL=1
MANVEKQIPNFNKIFDKVLTSEDFAASKPNPDCYIKAAKACGCERSECVVFEDAFTGLQTGRDSGIFTIGLSMSDASKPSPTSVTLYSTAIRMSPTRQLYKREK